jgi:WD40 repeat protein
LRMVAGTQEAREALYWDIDPTSPTNGKVLARLGGYQGVVMPAAFSPDGHSAVICSGDWFGGTDAKNVILWNLDETSAAFGKPIYTLTGLTYYPRSAAFTPDGSKLLVGTQIVGGAGELAVWEVATGTLHRIETGRDVSGILAMPDGKRALTASAYFNDLIEWDIDPASPHFGKEIRRIQIGTTTYDVEWGPGGTTILVAQGNGMTERDYTTGKLIRYFQGQGQGRTIWSVALSRDGRLVVTGDDIGEIMLWDYQSGGELWRSGGQEDFVNDIAFNPDNQTVFSLAFSGQPVQWRMSNPSLAELLTWIPNNRYLREFTCAERAKYRVEPLCKEGNP